jgi:hypothetical protein
MSRNFLAGLLAILLLSRAEAADDLVRFPSGNAAWTADISHHGPAAVIANPESYVPRKAKKVEVMQVNGAKRIVITWSDGKVSERWAVANLPVVFEQDPRDPKVVIPVQTGSLGNKITEFEIPYDASAFAWVRPQLLEKADPVKYRNKDCFHYVGTIVYPASPGDDPPPIKAEAWIDSKTLLPVALDSETTLSVFTFQNPPTAPLEIPAVFRQRIARYKAAAGIP